MDKILIEGNWKKITSFEEKAKERLHRLFGGTAKLFRLVGERVHGVMCSQRILERESGGRTWGILMLF